MVNISALCCKPQNIFTKIVASVFRHAFFDEILSSLVSGKIRIRRSSRIVHGISLPQSTFCGRRHKQISGGKCGKIHRRFHGNDMGSRIEPLCIRDRH